MEKKNHNPKQYKENTSQSRRVVDGLATGWAIHNAWQFMRWTAGVAREYGPDLLDVLRHLLT